MNLHARRLGTAIVVVFLAGLFALDHFFGELNATLGVAALVVGVAVPLLAGVVLGWIFWKVFLRQMLRDRKARLLRFNRHRLRTGT